ncbi:alpha/beta fold hydrolase [Bacillus sp. V3]|nr:alpha/beta fold hydrolase [Bacillus sp. V3]
MWEQQLVHTNRGIFEVFVQGEGEPVCITHLYSEFTELGYYLADTFINDFKVFLVNLKDAGNSCKSQAEEELSMKESVKDLEAIREALGFAKWSYAGHSTGGMLGLVYGLMYSNSLSRLMAGGASATNRYMEHEESMYSPNSPLNKQLKEIFAVLKSSSSTPEEKRTANKEWTNMSLYNVEKRDGYFKRPTSGKVVQKRLDYYSFNELPSFDIKKELSKIDVPTMEFRGLTPTSVTL